MSQPELQKRVREIFEGKGEAIGVPVVEAKGTLLLSGLEGLDQPVLKVVAEARDLCAFGPGDFIRASPPLFDVWLVGGRDAADGRELQGCYAPPGLDSLLAIARLAQVPAFGFMKIAHIEMIYYSSN